MDIPLLALVAHHEPRVQPHIAQALVQVPCHAEARAAAHPGIDIVLVAVVEVARRGRTAGRFQAYNFREVLIRHVREPVAQVENLLPRSRFHK